MSDFHLSDDDPDSIDPNEFSFTGMEDSSPSVVGQEDRSIWGLCEVNKAPHPISRNMSQEEIFIGLDNAKIRFESGKASPEERSTLISFINHEYILPADHEFCFNYENGFLPYDDQTLSPIPVYNHGRRWRVLPIAWSKDAFLKVIILSMQIRIVL